MNKKLSTPMAIIFAGVIIAFAIILTKGPSNTNSDSVNNQVGPSLDLIAEVTNKDHIRGDINAPVIIIEYSDFECPFCKQFHVTLSRIMNEYENEGEVAWVYRHFPLDNLHPVKARLEAVTSECIVEQGGNDAFWAFADAFFQVTPSNNRTEVDIVLPKIISDLGLSQEKIDECVTSGRYDQHVQDDIDNAIATGGRGTPWSVIVTKNGKQFSVSGSQPYSTLTSIIDIALKEVK